MDWGTNKWNTLDPVCFGTIYLGFVLLARLLISAEECCINFKFTMRDAHRYLQASGRLGAIAFGNLTILKEVT